MKRLLFLDILRGSFILVVILLHAFSHVLFWNATLVAREDIPVWLIAVFAPLILVGTWAPMFALISGAATAYVLYNLLQQDQAHLGRHVRGIYCNSVFLFCCSLLHMAVLHFGVKFNGAVRHTFLTGSIERGYLAKGDVDLLFFTDAVGLMAMVGIVIATILWAIWRNGGHVRPQRAYAVLTGLGLFWFLIAPLMHAWLDGPFFSAVTDRRIFDAILLKFIIGPPHSTFPNVGFAMFGAVLGMAVARREDYRRIRRYGYGFGLLFVLVSGAILLLYGVPLGPERIGTALPVQLHALNLGLMVIVATFLVGVCEYRPGARRLAVARLTTALRRYSMLAMTIYICESLICVINMKWFMPIFDGAPLGFRLAGIFIFGGMHIVIWYGILRLWERIDFKYSLEWWGVAFVGWMRGRRSERLRVRDVLYNPVSRAEIDAA